jgi:hypothetical protein
MKALYIFGLYLGLAMLFPYKEFLESVNAMRKSSWSAPNSLLRTQHSIYLVQNYVIRIGRNFISSLQKTLSGGQKILSLNDTNIVEARFLERVYSIMAGHLVTELKTQYFKEIREESEGIIYESMLLDSLTAEFPVPYELSNLVSRKNSHTFYHFIGIILKNQAADDYNPAEFESFLIKQVFYRDAYKTRCMVNALFAYKGALCAKKYIKPDFDFPFVQRVNHRDNDIFVKYINANVTRYFELKERGHLFNFSFVDSAFTLSYLYYLFNYLFNVAVLWDLNFQRPDMFERLEKAHLDFFSSSLDLARTARAVREDIKTYRYGGFICPNPIGEMEILPAELLRKEDKSNCSHIANVVFYKLPSDDSSLERLSSVHKNFLAQQVTCACINQGGVENLLIYTCVQETDTDFTDRMFGSMAYQRCGFSNHYNQALRTAPLKE